MEIRKEMKWYPVAPVESFPLKEGKRILFGHESVVVFNLGEVFLATDSRCPHKGGPLEDGIVAGKSVFCPLHNWKINLENGCALSGGTGQVKTYPVKTAAGYLYVAFEDGKFENCEVSQQSSEAKDL